MSNSKDSFDRYPYLKHSTAEPPKVKLTFEEWYVVSGWKDQHRVLSIDDADSAKYMMGVSWKAAQENK